MKQKLTKAAPYLLLFAANFYLLPLLMQNTGTAMLLTLCVMPLLTFCTALFYGARQGFHPLLPAAALLLFLPTLPLYYNVTAWPHAIIHAILALAGMSTGRLFHGKR